MKVKQPNLLREDLQAQTNSARKNQYNTAEEQAAEVIASIPAKLHQASKTGEDVVMIQFHYGPGVRDRVLLWLDTERLEHRLENGRLMITWR